MKDERKLAMANCSLFAQSSTLVFLTANKAVVTLTGVQVNPNSCTWDSAATSVSAVPACAVPGTAITLGTNVTIDIDISGCASGTQIYVIIVLRCVCGSNDNFTTISLTGTKP